MWVPKVTDFTTDATLLPENAPAGEIFYNNNGRQVGTGKSIKSIVLTPDMAGISSRVNVRVVVDYRKYYANSIFDLSVVSKPFEEIIEGNKITAGISTMLGVKINGVLNNICYNKEMNPSNGIEACQIWTYKTDNSGWMEPYIYFYIYNGDIYLHTMKTGYTVEVFYI